MDLRKHKAIFFAAIAISSLFVASPALQKLLAYPQTDFYTEMWLLGSTHLAQDYPHNIAKNVSYNVYLGIANHLGSSSYYQIEIKVRNETQPEANSFNRTFSSQPSLYNMTAFIANKETWETPLEFSFDYYNVSDGNATQINFNSLRLNDVSLNLKGYSSTWNNSRRDFYEGISFELWIYNSTVRDFQYNERFITLRFNMTA